VAHRRSDYGVSNGRRLLFSTATAASSSTAEAGSACVVSEDDVRRSATERDEHAKISGRTRFEFAHSIVLIKQRTLRITSQSNKLVIHTPRRRAGFFDAIRAQKQGAP
jgi:hypothetical protein